MNVGPNSRRPIRRSLRRTCGLGQSRRPTPSSSHCRSRATRHRNVELLLVGNQIADEYRPHGSNRQERHPELSSATSGAAVTHFANRADRAHLPAVRRSMSERPLESSFISNPERWCTTADLFLFRFSCPRTTARVTLVFPVQQASLFLPLIFPGHCFGPIPAPGSFAEWTAIEM